MKPTALTIIVDPDCASLFQITTQTGLDTVSIGEITSRYLLAQENTDRSHGIERFLGDTLRQMGSGPVVCAEIDLLFHPSFNLDPLILFRHISRFTSIIVLWPGTYKEGILSYARPEHQHYRSWRNLEGIEIKGVSNAL